jgi:putative hydrolase of the HAD superfamily
MADGAVIFDLDGTLFDHRGAASEAVARWALDLGVEPTEDITALWFSAEERFIAAWHRGHLDWQGRRRPVSGRC